MGFLQNLNPKNGFGARNNRPRSALEKNGRHLETHLEKLSIQTFPERLKSRDTFKLKVSWGYGTGKCLQVVSVSQSVSVALHLNNVGFRLNKR